MFSITKLRFILFFTSLSTTRIIFFINIIEGFKNFIQFLHTFRPSYIKHAKLMDYINQQLKHPSVEVLEKLIAKGMSIHHLNQWGRPIILELAPDVECFKYLISLDTKHEYEKDKILFYCVREGLQEQILYLIKNGLDIRLKGDRALLTLFIIGQENNQKCYDMLVFLCKQYSDIQVAINLLKLHRFYRAADYVSKALLAQKLEAELVTPIQAKQLNKI